MSGLARPRAALPPPPTHTLAAERALVLFGVHQFSAPPASEDERGLHGQELLLSSLLSTSTAALPWGPHSQPHGWAAGSARADDAAAGCVCWIAVRRCRRLGLELVCLQAVRAGAALARRHVGFQLRQSTRGQAGAGTRTRAEGGAEARARAGAKAVVLAAAAKGSGLNVHSVVLRQFGAARAITTPSISSVGSSARPPRSQTRAQSPASSAASRSCGSAPASADR